MTLGVMNYLILKAVEKLEEVLPPPQTPPTQPAVNGHNKRRRRRRRHRLGSQLLSDLSDEEDEFISSDSEMSEEELVFDAHSSESENEQENKETEPDVELDPKRLQLGETPAVASNAVLDHFEALCQQGFLLQTIKVCGIGVCKILQ